MAIGYVLYNEKAGNEDSRENVKNLDVILSGDVKFLDVTQITNYRVFLSGLAKEDYIVLAGGDGTLNCFANNTEGIEFDNEVFYYPNGTGNDFAHDLGHEKECIPFPITAYLKNLPVVTVNGKSYRFINGVGYGIDGYCCEVGDELKKIPGKKINYSSIAIKGLLFHYKPTRAKVTVDGKTSTYKKVWIAPTMNGRFYGGGIMPTPNQVRNSETVSTMLLYGSGKLKTLLMFPSLFKGEHLKYKKHVELLTGSEVTVEFDRPVALQIDGETILNVSSYSVRSCVPSITAKTVTEKASV